MTTTGPVRVLHVVGAMNRGGTETWLVNVLRHIDRSRFQFDFLVHTAAPGVYDEEITSLGGRLVPCLRPSRPLAYLRRLQRILRGGNPYDIVHGHVHHFNGLVLKAAAAADVPARIAQSHSDTSREKREGSLLRRAYLSVTERLVDRHAAAGIGVSDKAAAALFGSAWRQDARWRVLHCGIDLAPFNVPVDRHAVRAELGIPPDAFVIGHVGRFVPVKNHNYLLRLAKACMAGRTDVWLLCVGDGPLLQDMQNLAARLGIADRTVFAGLRPDVPRVMIGAIDTFVFPSIFEGLPLTCVEAQAAGLPAFISSAVTSEVRIVPELVRPLDTSKSPESHAAAVMAQPPGGRHVVRQRACRRVAEAGFGIERSIENLIELYHSALRSG